MVVLKAINAARFGSMETRIGHEEEGGEAGRLEQSATIGLLNVSVGPLSKLVLQMRDGEQSKRLEKLARTILGLSAPCGTTGNRSTNLAEGLADIAAGKLAPESLHIVVQRKIDHPGDPAETEGWRLEMMGPQAVSRALPRSGPEGTARWLRLSPPQMQEMVSLLRSNDPAALPQSLFAPQYTDLRIRVLGSNRYVNARPFAGMTPTTHGAKQEQFDRIYAALRKLGEHVRTDGRPAVEILPTADAGEEETEREREKKEEQERKGEKPPGS